MGAPDVGLRRVQIARFKPGEKFSLVEYTPAASVGSPAAGGEVSLALTLKSQHGLHKYAFEEEAYLSVECERVRSADELNGDYAYPLQNLMTFVCDRPQRVEEFSVYPATPSRERPVSPIQVIGARVQPEDDEEAKDPVRRFQMLFTLQDADFAVLVAKWFQLMERYDAACNIYFGLKYGPPAYVDMTFAGMRKSCTCTTQGGMTGWPDGPQRSGGSRKSSPGSQTPTANGSSTTSGQTPTPRSTPSCGSC